MNKYGNIEEDNDGELTYLRQQEVDYAIINEEAVEEICNFEMEETIASSTANNATS